MLPSEFKTGVELVVPPLIVFDQRVTDEDTGPLFEV